MNLLPSSLVLTNLFTIVCRLLSCDSEIENPTGNERSPAAARRIDNYDYVDKSSNTIVNHQENLEVSTKAGRIQGFHMKNVRGDPIYAFEGTPIKKVQHMHNVNNVSNFILRSE